METLKQQLFSGWNLMRWIRLIIGIALAIEAFSGGNIIFGFVAAILLLQVFTNTGCGGGSCNIPQAKPKSNTAPE
jgi:hypothetical protein